MIGTVGAMAARRRQARMKRTYSVPAAVPGIEDE